MKILNIVLIALFATLLIPFANAAAPTAASGSFTGAITTTNVRTAGGNMILTQNDVFTITGTFAGTCTGPSTTVVHPHGTATSRGRCTFTGTVNGVSGTAVFLNIAHGRGSSFRGHFVVLSGTGGLANLRASGSFSGMGTSPTSNAGTYSGHIDFVHQ